MTYTAETGLQVLRRDESEWGLLPRRLLSGAGTLSSQPLRLARFFIDQHLMKESQGTREDGRARTGEPIQELSDYPLSRLQE